MPVAYLKNRTRKDGLKATAEGVRGSAANEVRRKTESYSRSQISHSIPLFLLMLIDISIE